MFILPGRAYHSEDVPLSPSPHPSLGRCAGVLRELQPIVRAVGQHSMVCPRLLAWMHEPQLVQRDEKELERYGLQELAVHYSLSDAAAELAVAKLPPLRRLHHDLKVGLRVCCSRPCSTKRVQELFFCEACADHGWAVIQLMFCFISWIRCESASAEPQ